MSVPHLLRVVTANLKDKYGEDLAAAGIAIPTVQWVALNFQPKNRAANAALNYTGRFNVVYSSCC